MEISALDEAFSKLLAERGVHTKLGITSEYVRTLRNKLKNGIEIGYNTKKRLLQKSGWSEEAYEFTRMDMLSFLKFYRNTSEAARKLDDAYVLDKFLAMRKTT
jgi:hypothetical protein